MSGAIRHGNEAIRHGLDHLAERAAELKAEVKPKLRGWLHLGTAPLTLAAGIVLIALSPTAATRVGSALFIGTARDPVHGLRDLPPRHLVAARLGVPAAVRPLQHLPADRRLLHAVQPDAARGRRADACCSSIVWSGAVLGVLFRVFWTGAPRWLYLPIYIALGWAAVFFIPSFADGASASASASAPPCSCWSSSAAALYTLGGVVYGFKRPDPWPRWFGFHEVFHTLHDPGLRHATTSASRWRRTPCAEPAASADQAPGR